MYHVYILQNPNGRFYVGQTDDLQRRLVEHNDPESSKRFTSKHGPWNLVWAEAHTTRTDAMARERQIKAMKSARWIRDTLLK